MIVLSTNQQNAASADESLSARLDIIAASLSTDPESVATGAGEILDIVPGQSQALLLLIAALKLMGMEEGAASLLQSMAQDYPSLASLHYALGAMLARLGQPKEAMDHFSRTVALEPNHPAAWRVLGDQLAAQQDRAGASKAYARHAFLSVQELKLVEEALCGGSEQMGKAENMLAQAVEINPTDVAAVTMLGELLLWRGRLQESKAILERALELAPECIAARSCYATVLTWMMDYLEANRQFEILLAREPENPRFRAFFAANLVMLGEHDEALRLFDGLLHDAPRDALAWFNFGNAARTVGMDDETIIGAYRKCIELDPSYGTAWWGLADIKTYRFTPAEISELRHQLGANTLSDGQRCHLEFALAKAMEDEHAYAESFEHYHRGNELRRPYAPYDADGMHKNVQLLKSVYTREFFERRGRTGCPSADPIFIVGMARAGSTLVEQILASHSEVEGTMELPDLGNMVGEAIRKQSAGKTFPAFLEEFDDDALAKMGQEYLERTRCQRKLGRPFFTDKAGQNFFHVGLIQLILPNAKIIDARRHPLACGFSCYKQAFAPGAMHLTYDQTDIGRFYRDYVDAMAHYDRVLPGRVHRVIHEHLVSDPEREIRRLLAYCDLPFEEQCLRSHETNRTVRTSSSQQVRQPIRQKKREVWENYEAWLQPMKDALGDVLTLYPEVPDFR